MEVVDRVKDVIKSGGEWISSIELENALMAHEDVAEAVVIAASHERWQERPLAFVVPKGGPRARRRGDPNVPRRRVPAVVAPGRRAVPRGDSEDRDREVRQEDAPGDRRRSPLCRTRRERRVENDRRHHPDAGRLPPGPHRAGRRRHRRRPGIGRAITLGMAAAGATVVPGGADRGRGRGRRRRRGPRFRRRSARYHCRRDRRRRRRGARRGDRRRVRLPGYFGQQRRIQPRRRARRPSGNRERRRRFGLGREPSRGVPNSPSRRPAPERRLAGASSTSPAWRERSASRNSTRTSPRNTASSGSRRARRWTGRLRCG